MNHILSTGGTGLARGGVIGAKIGKGCVVGANAVVTKDIPDHCVAVGAPAKVKTIL